MPYYVYRIGTLGVLTKLAEFAAFRDASSHAKTLRATAAAGPAARVKVMFADNELTAEDLLGQVREDTPGVTGDD